MKERICVYTCITGNYDDLNELKNIEKGIDYYCFTNNEKLKSDTWNVIYVEDKDLSNVKLARKIKILGHPSINEKYDILVWMDGAVTFKKNISEFVKEYLKDGYSFAAFKHNSRDNIYDECNACLIARKEKQDNVKKLLQFYKKEKYPDNNGLIESTVYIKRPKDKKVIETMNLWFDMILNYTHRDQLSFNYCIYKTGLKVNWINKNVFSNEWFKWKRHNPTSYIIDNYRLYFGDINSYDAKCDFIKQYSKKDNKYLIDIKVPYDIDTIYLEFSNIECTLLKGIKINGKDAKNVLYNNYVDYDGNKLFYERKASLKINRKFKKGEKIKFELDMEIKSEAELYDVIEALSIKYNYAIKELNKISDLYSEILNSKGWKILEKLRKLKPGRK